MVKTLRFVLFYCTYCVVVCAAGLVLVEGAVRLCTDRPLGLFDATPLNHTSLYHPNSRIPMELMSVPYLVETNSLGFRGPEITKEKPPGITRIVSLGDSITDGFLVDNPDTYPVLLEGQLRASGYTVEVVNAARGGSSIDREYWILRHYVADLKPDVVVLTYVANDIYEMRNKSVEELIGYDPEPLAFLNYGALWAARSATGEWLLDSYFTARFPGYRGHGLDHETVADASRYVVPGGMDYGALLPGALGNLQSLKHHLPQPDPVVLARADVYLNVLEDMDAWCTARNIQLVWAWSATFVQIYGDTPSEPIYEYLLPRVAAAGIPVVDCTPYFRDADRGTPLTLAPVDYHFTPAGNGVLARAIAHGLVDHGILKAVNREVE